MRWIRLGMVTITAAVAILTPALPVAPVPPASAETLFAQYIKPNPGPRGAVTVIGDSVMLGSALETNGYGPSVAQMLVDRGWGPVRMVAGVGLQAGLVASNPGADMTKWVLDRRAEGWDSPAYMISLGPNDIGSCSFRQPCAEQDILRLVDTIGSDREIWWSMITMPLQSDADVWNRALAVVAVLRPNLHLWDWPAAIGPSGIILAADNVHLPNGAEYRKKSALMAADFTDRLGVSDAVPFTSAPLVARGVLTQYVPVAQHRVYDSRVLGTRPSSVQLDLSHDVPAGTAAVSINLTAIAPPPPTAPGYLTAYPCGGAVPPSSSVNFAAGQIRPNQVVVALGPGATLCIAVSTPTDVVVDLQGAFVGAPTPDGLQLNPLAASRLVDTRLTGRADPLVVTVPVGADVAVLNLTAVNAAVPGYLVAYPCDGPVPDTSNINFVVGDAAAGSAYVAVSAIDTVCVHTNVAADVIVDLQGTLSATGALRFQPAEPQRMLDTRTGMGGWHGQIGVGQRVDIPVAPGQAQAVTGNLTMVQPGVDGYATAFGCAEVVPKTSSVNSTRANITANAVTTSANGTLCILSSVAAHFVFDTTGWWVP